VPIFGATGTPTLNLSADRLDLTTPQPVTQADQGTGAPFLPYNFAACGDTYWEGDGLGASMENLSFEDVIRVLPDSLFAFMSTA